jgi:hypothetical protein
MAAKLPMGVVRSGELLPDFTSVLDDNHTQGPLSSNDVREPVNGDFAFHKGQDFNDETLGRDGKREMPHRYEPVRNDLAHLRSALPFVPIIPIPKTRWALALGAGNAGFIRVPEQAVLMKLTGITAFYWNNNSQADGQDSVAAQTSGNPGEGVDNLANFSTDWMYCYGARQIGVRSIAANNQIVAQFLMRDEI